jgi:hypothetical protein
MVTYKWGSGAGADLDTFTGIVNTGVSIRQSLLDMVVHRHLSPSGSSISTSYVFWAGDDNTSFWF